MSSLPLLAIAIAMPGLFEFFILSAFFLIPIVLLLIFPSRLSRRARLLGYPSLRIYLRAIPETPPQIQDAAELTLQGIVLCLLGFLFPLIVLLGLIPLYYGARKLLLLHSLPPR